MQLTRSALRAPCSRSLAGRSRRAVVVRADASVQDLLARDRKTPKLKEDLTDAAAKPATKSERREVVKTREKRRSDARARTEGVVAAVAPVEVEDPNRPKRCKEAIDKGLELFQQKKFEEAVAMFNLALELPGNGAYRMPGSPREFSCPSDAEEQGALYNMACCYAQMGQAQAALTCLEAVLDSGFEDFKTMRSDPDLAPARGPKFEELMSKYDGPFAMLKKLLPNNGDKQMLVSDTNKPWLLW
ncbi:hypothetical protein HYH03_001011 [Edaphochlamys debaryana]|uniref:Uncharacterized protein n=1 Tax=Edaphochlamys debaryana TaxID=47281 RepID=A0A835YE23_9CHLO|nr:hypothetical protein HYH03_001011 [Edaphochlamys debaryana]|eukprot:KAG2501197.1 hypothetical protein HYH03_001011 [Edaphochlamys debaryana]